MDRRDQILRHVDREGRGLELGPSYNPVAPKAEGFDVVTVDHAPREELVAKYREHGVDEKLLAQIEDVDVIWEGGGIADLVQGEFDYIIASHVLEHTVDLIGVIGDCARLLRPGGILTLVLPDKRFCFDALRPISTVGQMVDAHLRPTPFHTPGTLADQMLYISRLDGNAITWEAGSRGLPELWHDDFDHIRTLIDEGTRQETYHDVHHWTFTPSSFSLAIHDLRSLGFTSLTQLGAAESSGFEFFVSLALPAGGDVTAATPEPVDRTVLLRAIELELVVGDPFNIVADLREELAAARAHDERRSAEVRDLRRRDARLRRSTSWRATAPARRAARAVRRLRDRVRAGTKSRAL